jgi:uncharacterized protein (TIGR00369 family)
VSRLDAAQLAALLSDTLPAIDYHGVEVEEVGDQEVRLRLPYDPAFVGAGGIFSGPTLLGFADTALYAAAQAATGDSVRALVSTMSVTFLKPAMAADVIAIARVISRTAKTAHLEAWLFSHAAVDPILHATATSVLRPAD